MTQLRTSSEALRRDAKPGECFYFVDPYARYTGNRPHLLLSGGWRYERKPGRWEAVEYIDQQPRPSWGLRNSDQVPAEWHCVYGTGDSGIGYAYECGHLTVRFIPRWDDKARPSHRTELADERIVFGHKHGSWLSRQAVGLREDPPVEREWHPADQGFDYAAHDRAMERANRDVLEAHSNSWANEHRSCRDD